jgi:hypothetical protein
MTIWGDDADDLDSLDFLFDKPEESPPFVKGSDTSKDAAGAIKASAGVLRAQVLRFIEDAGNDGATDEEIQTALDMNPSTERPRRGELVTQGAVKDSGVRRPTRSGRQAGVWVAVPLALRDEQRETTKAKGALRRELDGLLDTLGPDELRWVIGMVKQRELLMTPTLEEIDAELALLASDDG